MLVSRGRKLRIVTRRYKFRGKHENDRERQINPRTPLENYISPTLPVCRHLHVYTRLQERDELFVLLALGRGEGMVAIWVLLACTWACNPGFVNGDTDGNDGEWVRIPGEPFEVAGLEQIFIKADVNTFLISHAPFAASALYVLFSSLNSASQLTGWKQSGGDPCGESWLGIKCSGSSVTAM
ncbi:hypothetical protein B296_00004724 [Ensete ventricosum]|uniref:Leucine-rich repeat-containing N-terminal plant-type domain-containing protein n=1 Tax=Ensete ventricosum TaxID=4639 RepID=A0A427ABY7_ENSVE|nr:hypothetical protein B296_00004724 [Ensete ventricosum]